MPFHASIAAAKGAVEGLTRSLAAEWAPKIRVNAIAPSLTDTPLAEKLLSTEDKRKASADRHPLQRVGSPEEVATLAAYLISADAGFITGQVIGIDGVAAFPTLYYMDADGEVVQAVKGAQKAEQFIRTGTKALALSEPTGDYAEAYEDGNRDPELVYKYVRSLIRNGESHLRVANDFLREQSDLSTPENLQFIMLAATEADSRIFTLMTEHKADIIAANSEDLYYSQVYAACQATAEKSIEYSSPELLEEACEKMKEHYSDKADEFRYVSEMAYAKAHRDGKTYARAARSYAKEILGKDAAKLNDFALRVSNDFDNDKNALEVAQYAATEAVRYNGDTFRHYYTLAIVEKKLGNTKQSLAAARKALELAEQDTPNAVRMLTAFIDTLEREG
eukprot:g456.t1